jgi:hypothetical protein
LIGALMAGLGSSAVAQAQESVNVDKLPLNLKRVQSQLQKIAEREDVGVLRLHYFVDVFGHPPPIELFTEADNLQTGPVPYGGPTHNEVLRVITPIEHRAPAMDLNALARWLAEKFSGKSETK